MTFIVRLFTEFDGRIEVRFRAVVEQVRTGRKEQVDTAEDIGRVIAAMVRGETTS
jgi:hypothetical protein